VAVIVGIFWAYGRKRRKLDGERAQRMEALLVNAKRAAGQGPIAAAVSGAPTAPPKVQAVLPQLDPQAPQVSRKQRLLSQPTALAYKVFRAGLPDHEIFAHLTLADLVEVDSKLNAYDREQKSRRLAQQRLDLVICNRQLEIVAAVLLQEASASDGAKALSSYAQDTLKEAGIRLLTISPSALPRHQEIRNLTYGVGA
jgi:hypothetical protein